MTTQRYRQQSSGATRQVKHTRLDDEVEISSFYTIGDVLGKGSFGTVKSAIDSSENSKAWAIKAINKEKAGTEAVKLLEREVAIMKKVDHMHIIHLEEVFETATKMFLVMELCAKGGLDKLLEQVTYFSEKDALCIMGQLVDAVGYMHDNDIIHRDLKLENILLSDPEPEQLYNIKITDFGLSYTRGGVDGDYMVNQVVGTPIYMAPEVIVNFGYSQQCDIWSCGVIMYKLFCGEPPFMANTEEELFEVIKAGVLNYKKPIWDNVTQAAKLLISSMLRVDPAHRITSKEILSHPWLKGQTDVNGMMTTNVLEMMKEFSREQREEAEKESSAKDTVTGSNDNENPEVVVDTVKSKDNISQKNSKKSVSVPSQSSNCQTRLQASGRGNTKSVSPSASSTTVGGPTQRKSTAKSGTLPSYMQPTASSKAPKNPHTRSGRKGKDT